MKLLIAVITLGIWLLLILRFGMAPTFTKRPILLTTRSPAARQWATVGRLAGRLFALRVQVVILPPGGVA